MRFQFVPLWEAVFPVRVERETIIQIRDFLSRRGYAGYISGPVRWWVPEGETWTLLLSVNGGRATHILTPLQNTHV